jgi:hypothetical protein
MLLVVICLLVNVKKKEIEKENRLKLDVSSGEKDGKVDK